MAPALVLLSGGMDSTTLLHYVAKELGHEPVFAVSFLYGQKHARELEAARYQSKAVNAASHRVVDIAFMSQLVGKGTTLVQDGEAVPAHASLEESQLDQPPTYVPNRNMVLLSLAAAYAEGEGIRHVFYGAQAQDEYGYWDCTADFLERLNAVFGLNRRDAITIQAPFISTRKVDILKKGLELGVDYAQTWTCYRGEDVPCQECPACIERGQAWKELGQLDPLLQAP